jgi:hypothetical protein
MSVMASVVGDDGLDSLCRQKLVPYEVRSFLPQLQTITKTQIAWVSPWQLTCYVHAPHGASCCVYPDLLPFCLSQIESKSGTVVLRWVNGQLERVETWVKRAAEQEVSTFLFVYDCFLVCVSILFGMLEHFVLLPLVTIYPFPLPPVFAS